MVRIGVLSDTHMPGSLAHMWPEVGEAFANADLILHSGDICHPRVLDQLEQWAPVLASRGNNDLFERGDPRVADVQWLNYYDFRIAMVHDMEPEDRPIEELQRRYLNGGQADVIITGHTHFERLDWRDGVLQVNSGSAVHPHLWSTRLGTVAVLDIGPGSLQARIVRLGETEGLRNPGAEYVFDGTGVTCCE
jgi:putative phosphoesterase